MTGTIQTFNFSVNLLQALLWQYDNAMRIRSLLQQKQDWYDSEQSGFWENWISGVFALETADVFGLSVWSIILQVPIIVSLNPSPTSQPTWGFGSFNQNYTNGNFLFQNGGAQVLSPEQARLVLQLRYFQLQSSGTIPEINRFLKFIFGSKYGRAYVKDDTAPMSIIYVFAFVPPSQLQFVLENFDILPRPAGVSVTYETLVPAPWGFDTPHETFDNGNFMSGA